VIRHWVGQGLDKCVILNQISFIEEVELSIELHQLLVETVKFSGFKEQIAVKGNELTLRCCGLSNLLLYLTSSKCRGILFQKFNNLRNHLYAEAFTMTEFGSSFVSIGSIVERKFTHDSISQLNIKNMVVLACFEKVIPTVLFGLSCSNAITFLSIRVVHNFSEHVPFGISKVPAISHSFIACFENLYISIFRSLNLAINFGVEVFQSIKIVASLFLCSSFTIALKLS
jgi:hypothetical protein